MALDFEPHRNVAYHRNAARQSAEFDHHCRDQAGDLAPVASLHHHVHVADGALIELFEKFRAFGEVGPDAGFEIAASDSVFLAQAVEAAEFLIDVDPGAVGDVENPHRFEAGLEDFAQARFALLEPELCVLQVRNVARDGHVTFLTIEVDDHARDQTRDHQAVFAPEAGLQVAHRAELYHLGAELVGARAVRPDGQFPKCLAEAFLALETGQANEFFVDVNIASAFVVDTNRIGTGFQNLAQGRLALAQAAFRDLEVRDEAHHIDDAIPA